jgi:hypothetical protein
MYIKQESIDCLKKKLKGKICMKAKEECLHWAHSDQIVLRTVMQGGWTAVRRWPKTLKY